MAARAKAIVWNKPALDGLAQNRVLGALYGSPSPWEFTIEILFVADPDPYA